MGPILAAVVMLVLDSSTSRPSHTGSNTIAKYSDPTIRDDPRWDHDSKMIIKHDKKT